MCVCVCECVCVKNISGILAHVLVIKSDEAIEVTKTTLTKTFLTKTIPTNFNEKKELAFSLITISLLIPFGIYYCFIKHRPKQNIYFQITTLITN